MFKYAFIANSGKQNQRSKTGRKIPEENARNDGESTRAAKSTTATGRKEEIIKQLSEVQFIYT